EHRVPDDDTPARPEAGRLRVRQRRRAADVLDDDRRMRDVLLPLEPDRSGSELRIIEPVRVQQIRRDEREERREPDAERRRRQPPAVPDEPRAAHDDQQREAEEEELAAEREPVAEDRRDVADLAQVVPPLPPQVENGERQLGNPEDREAEHPEQHPRPHRARSRIGHESGATPRIHGEHEHVDDQPADPQQAVDARERVARMQLRSREVLPLVEVRQIERAGHLRAPEEPRRHSPDGSKCGEHGGPPHATRAHAASYASYASTAGGAAPPRGLPGGYPSGIRERYAYTCAGERRPYAIRLRSPHGAEPRTSATNHV